MSVGVGAFWRVKCHKRSFPFGKCHSTAFQCVLYMDRKSTEGAALTGVLRCIDVRSDA